MYTTDMMFRPNFELATQRPRRLGKVFYVWNGGSASSEGTDPDFPISTIAAAQDLCTANRNDYIFVIDHWSESDIDVDVEGIHIIGTGSPTGLRTCLTAGDVNVFTIKGSGLYAEIAGFNLGGGSSAAGIKLDVAVGAWIHHNLFGHTYPGDTPLYGIWGGTAGDSTECVVEDNIFWGDKKGGTITSSGISMKLGSGDHWERMIIRRNMFMGLEGAGGGDNAGAICIDGGLSMMITDNYFHTYDAHNGDSINLIDVCQYCLIMNNKSAHGMGVASGNNITPYRDLNTNTLNAWAWNSYGNSYIEPVGV